MYVYGEEESIFQLEIIHRGTAGETTNPPLPREKETWQSIK
jgi:hypothetical protein